MRGAFALGTVSTLLPSMAFAAKPAHDASVRTLSLRNLHTNEHVRATYFEGGQYVDGPCSELNALLRDWRTGDVYAMEPRLLDYLHALQSSLAARGEVHIISGYRSPKTNAALRKQGRGVAKRSLHMRGMAMDVRFPKEQLGDVRRAAMALQRGGVGFYAKSNFLHIDIGRPRSWG